MKSPPETWLCSADAISTTFPFPPVWVSPHDVSDASAGIHCGRIDPAFGWAADRVMRTISKFEVIP